MRKAADSLAGIHQDSHGPGTLVPVTWETLSACAEALQAGNPGVDGVVSISLLASPHVNALLSSWPVILRLLINMGITVLLLTYWVMPFPTHCFKNWLFKA